MDLLVPSSKTRGCGSTVAALVIVDCFTRMTFVTQVKSYSLPHLASKVGFLFRAHDLHCRVLITDRQSSFSSSKFLEFMSAHHIRVKLCPRDRHFDFNPVAERATRSLKVMARAANTDAGLDDTFWYLAVQYAAFVKNRVHHSSLDYAPLTIATGKVWSLKVLRRFGSVCYALPAQDTKVNKMMDHSQSYIFLGFEVNSSSANTTIVLNLVTKRIAFPHLSDLNFDERLNAEDVPSKVPTRPWKSISYRRYSGPDYSTDSPSAPFTGFDPSHQDQVITADVGSDTTTAKSQRTISDESLLKTNSNKSINAGFPSSSPSNVISSDMTHVVRLQIQWIPMI